MAQQQQPIQNCSNCDRSIGRLEHRYEVDGQIVCTQCAAVFRSAPADEESVDEPERDTAEDLVSFSANSTPTSRRRGVSRAATKRSSATPFIAFGVGIVVVTGGLGWLYKNGTLDSWMKSTKSDISGVTSDNEQVAQYNALIAGANEQAQNYKYAEAASKLRAAKLILDKNPRLLPGMSSNAMLDLVAKIAQYETRAKVAPGSSQVPTPAPPQAKSPGNPPSVNFMANGNANTTPAPAPPPAPALPPVVPATPKPLVATGGDVIPIPEDAVDATPPSAAGGLPAVVEAPIGTTPAAPRPVAPPPEPVDPAPVAEAPKSPSSVDLSSNDPDALAKAGWDKMRGGDVTSADQLFKKSLQLAGDRDKSTIGQAVLPAFAQQPREAIARLEKLLAQRNAHATAVNLASLYLKDNPVRAAKLLRDYLATQKSIDETTLNYLGVALRQSEQKAGTSASFKEQTAFYEQCETKLAAAHPGQKRWGSTWIASADADRKRAALAKARAGVDTSTSARRSADLRADRARQLLSDRAATLPREDVMALRQAEAEAEKAAADAKQNADKAQADYAALEPPPLPDAIPIVEP